MVTSESSLGYPGWRVVLAAHLGVMVSFGSLLVFTFSVFLKPLTAEFGWSREEVSRAFGIAAMAVALASPVLGRMLDRGAPRRIVLFCITVFGLAFGSLSLLTPHLWHLYTVFLVLGVVGNGTTQMGYSGAVSSWFSQRRGMALALVMAGTGIGSIVLPPLAQTLITGAGWRNAYLFLGGLVLLAGVPLTALYLRRSPAAPGLATIGAVPSTSVAAALRTRIFWILVATLFLSSIAANGAITHLAALLNDRGIAPGQAALVTSALGGASFIGRLLTGALLDRFFGPRISFLLLFIMAAGILLLAGADSWGGGMAAAILIGFGLGGEADVTPYLLSRYFGLDSFSTLYGLTWTLYAVAGAIGPVLVGRMFDLTASYTNILTLLSIPTLFSAILMLWMPRYERAA
ncbi:MAG: MFS transporter [Bryobacteraceae bacterium]